MIIVCPLNKLEAIVSDHRPSHVVSLLGAQSEMPDFSNQPETRHLKLSFNDISAARDDLILPGEIHIEELLKFVATWYSTHPLVIHCWAGISRSTAAAYITQCALHEERDELELARRLRAASPSATPNQRMIELADNVLGRAGRMGSAIASIGRGAEAWEGKIFTLPVSS
jgi:predicted protein tyrosine phosphatase